MLTPLHIAFCAHVFRLGINYWLKSKLLDVTTPGVTEQFWLGAENEGRHSENAPGEWTWPHKGRFL